MWISLWIVQTLTGAVLWRRFFKNNKNNDSFDCLLISVLVLPNILFILASITHLTCKLIDYLAGVKNKTKDENR